MCDLLLDGFNKPYLSHEKLTISKNSFFCLFSVKKRRNWHRHDYSEIDDGSKVTLNECQTL